MLKALLALANKFLTLIDFELFYVLFEHDLNITEKDLLSKPSIPNDNYSSLAQTTRIVKAWARMYMVEDILCYNITMENPLEQKGFSLVEMIVAVAIFALISVSIFQLLTSALAAIKVSRFKITAIALANEQFEIIRNLPYSDVGLVSGIPSGVIDHLQTLTRDNTEFLITTTIRNIDDPFDGTISGVPNDLSPADYKLVEVEVSCSVCGNFQPIALTTQVGPRGLETSSTNGALFVRVFDASGQPIAGAQVHIENNLESPAIIIDDTTNSDGLLPVVDAPPGVEAYEITVTKAGYSTDQTYLTGAVGNPNPTKPHATVSTQQLTQISFAIDQLSSLEIASVNDTCGAVPDITFNLEGSKQIGVDVPKYSAAKVTDGSGLLSLASLEWDTYDLDLTDAAHQLAGVIPLFPLSVNPGTSQNVKLIVESKYPNSLLVTVKDASTQLPLPNATVRLEKTGYDTTLLTGRGFLRQTDWSGGSGQAAFVDSDKYFNSDGNIEINDPDGELKLLKVFSEYQLSGNLVSSTFDTGSVSDFHQILWQPQSQPVDAGADSVRFQIASNNDQATWDFTGPDGTAGTYYTLVDQNINPNNNGNRYFRYKLYMQTASSTWTPTISDVSLTFTSSCVPPGQVIFHSLPAGDYNLTVSNTGYQTATDIVAISSAWAQTEITLSP